MTTFFPIIGVFEKKWQLALPAAIYYTIPDSVIGTVLTK